jgi:hypothetical protein
MMKIHSEQLFNYLKSRGFELTEEDRANIVEIILFGKNDKGKYSQQRENILSKERKVLVDRRPEILDINPKNWLKPYQKNTVWYMLKMGLFYHIIGLILMYLGSSLVTSVISDYTAPQIPVCTSDSCIYLTCNYCRIF